MTIKSRAPVRLSFCGGGTDIAAYYEKHGGVVLSTTIDKYSHVELRTRDEREIEISSSDYGKKVRGSVGTAFSYNGTLDLIKAVINVVPQKKGFTLTTYQDVPSASGLGTSASMAVALLGALLTLDGREIKKDDIAASAYRLEFDELRHATGKQDQYAASFGGLNLIEFTREETVVTPLRLPAPLQKRLQGHLLLMNIGGAHVSGDLQSYLIGHMQKETKATMKGLTGLKKLTYAMRDDLLAGKLDAFGEKMHQAFVLKKMSSAKVSNEHIDAMYALAREHGALGGKISGAGGSGNMLLFCPIEKQSHVRRVLEEVGGEDIPFSFEDEGLVVSKDE